MGYEGKDALDPLVALEEGEELTASSTRPVSARESDLRSLVLHHRQFAGEPSKVLDFCDNVRVKGETVAHRIRFVHEQYGQEALEDLIEAAPPRCKEMLIDPPLAFEWLATRELVSLDYHMFRMAMRERYPEMERFGYEIASYDLPFRYRVLLRVGSPEFIVKHASRALRAYFRPAEFQVRALLPGSALIRLVGPMPRYVCANIIMGWAKRAIELSGGSEVEAVHARCQHTGAEHCEYQIRWQ